MRELGTGGGLGGGAFAEALTALPAGQSHFRMRTPGDTSVGCPILPHSIVSFYHTALSLALLEEEVLMCKLHSEIHKAL